MCNVDALSKVSDLSSTHLFFSCACQFVKFSESIKISILHELNEENWCDSFTATNE